MVKIFLILIKILLDSHATVVANDVTLLVK